MVFGPTHTFLRGLASYAFASFWYKVEVHTRVGGLEVEELVPEEGTPMIVVANHWNSAADVAVLSCYFPHYRKLHYWAKSTLFAPGLPRKILLDAGNLPVDRKTKDNQKLFASSFDALKAGEAIAVFPEGGSYTVHELPALKDGASWCALEYAKNLRDPRTRRVLSDGSTAKTDPKDVVISIAGIAYSDKTKYRSCAVMEFGPNIPVEPYVEEFLVSPKTAVKKLTAKIHEELVKVIVNAPDWESRHAATMARKILWPDDKKLPLRHMREIDQTLIDLFAAPNPSASLRRLRRLLNVYRDALYSTGVTHLSLSSLPLPATLDPSVPHPLPTRMRVLGTVILSTLACLIRLPFFLFPLIVHLPVYLFARYAASNALEEDQAQNKVALGLVLALVTYATFFAVACALLWTSIPWGGALLVAIVGTIAFVAYHNRLIDDNYRKFQRLLALWTVLFALWTPVAQSEASHFLHSVHPSLSPAPPRPGADGQYVSLETEDEMDALIGAKTTDYEDAETGDERSGREGDSKGRRKPLPSPALFSEEDHLLGNFPHPHLSSGSHHHPSHQPDRPATPVNGTRTPRTRTSTAAGSTRTSEETTIEMPPLASGIAAHEEGAPVTRAQSRPPRRSRAREIRALLRLRAETVARLREALFDSPADGDDEFEDGFVEASRLYAGANGNGAAGSSAPIGFEGRENASRLLARQVGERMKELGWRGAGLGSGKLA
ncbi:Glycerol-3-phosphate O-acyltransferase 2 [Rhodotorula toruloides]|nr:Glycerol-3-phosphate O-acyltransferase 2 [Rhodotorula toruloides]